MKKILHVIAILLFSLTCKAQIPPFAEYEPVILQNVLKNGIYQSIIDCRTITRGVETHRATYRLNVKVERDNVVAILFEDGGSVHSGFNNHGYIFHGGRLSFKRDAYGNVVGVIAKVQVDYPNGRSQVFTISL